MLLDNGWTCLTALLASSAAGSEKLASLKVRVSRAGLHQYTNTHRHARMPCAVSPGPSAHTHTTTPWTHN